MTSTHAQSIVVLGGGLAGLTAAYRLILRGYRVTIVDQHSRPEQSLVGNGPEPFTVLGCHHATQALLRSLHPNSQEPAQAEVPLEFLLHDHSLVRYPRTWLPAPLNTWVNLLRFSGIPWRARWQLASWMERLWEGEERLPADLEQRTADEWLSSIDQNEQTRRIVWNPLAQWLTGNDLSMMSADALVTSLKPPFLSGRQNSRVFVRQDSIDRSFIQPITEALARSRSSILRNVDVTQLHYERDHIAGVLLRDGSLLQADWYIAALPPQQLTPLLPERWLTRYAYFQQLAELASIDKTVHHVIAEQPCAASRLVLLGGTAFHSALTTAAGPNRTDVTLITTGSPVGPTRPDSDRQDHIQDLLRSSGLLLSNSTILSIRHHIIPNAILSLRPGTKLHRPIQRSPIANLLVAGAWTDTGWPPNLESAIVSGNRCADALALT